MKCQKLTFMSPLYGGIESNELLKEFAGDYDLSPQQFCKVFNEYSDIQDHLEEYNEDLTEQLPENLKNIVFKAEFGNYEQFDDKIYLLTEIHTRRELNDVEAEILREWIIGQLSDGWGESLSGYAAHVRDVDVPILEFDTYSCDFEEDSFTEEVRYYIRAWCWGDTEFSLKSIEDSDLTPPDANPCVSCASSKLQESGIYRTRTVYMFTDIQDAVLFMQYSDVIYSDEQVQFMRKMDKEDGRIHYYVVCENEGIFTRFIPMFGILNIDNDEAKLYSVDAETGCIGCIKYDHTGYLEFYSLMMEK